jgi:hypothetical protein
MPTMSSIECSNAPASPFFLAMALDVIRHPAESQEVLGPKARQPVLEVEALALAHFLPHARETRIRDAKVFHDAAHARLQLDADAPDDENRLVGR